MLDYAIRLDYVVERYLILINDPVWARLFYFITEFGSTLMVSAIVLLVVYFLIKKDRGVIKYFAAAIITDEILVYVIKKTVGRPRPFGALNYGEFDYSMPSGHAAISILLYGYIIYLIIKYCRQCLRMNAAVVLLALLIALIGFSRLYLNVHYLSDVLMGYLFGGVILWWLIKKTKRQPPK